MPTAFTAGELAAFERTLRETAPSFPVATDLDAAADMTGFTTASAPEGLLLNTVTHQGKIKFYLNPVVARQLAMNIIRAGNQSGWWDTRLNLIAKD
jgi:hypothetical protein